MDLLTYVRILESLEPLHAVLLGGGLFLAGKKAVEGKEVLQACGWKLGALSTIAYVLWALFTRRVDSAILCVYVIGFGFGLVGVSFIGVTIVSFIWNAVSSMYNRATGWLSGWSQAWHDRRSRRALAKQHELDAATEKAETDARGRQQEEQRRREHARSQCVFAFRRLAKQLGDRYTQEMLRSDMEAYMSDSKDVNTVEQQGLQIVALMDRFAQESEPEATKPTLKTDGDEYERQKKELEDSNLDAEIKDTLLCQLKMNFVERAQKRMEHP